MKKKAYYILHRKINLEDDYFPCSQIKYMQMAVAEIRESVGGQDLQDLMKPNILFEDMIG